PDAIYFAVIGGMPDEYVGGFRGDNYRLIVSACFQQILGESELAAAAAGRAHRIPVRAILGAHRRDFLQDFLPYAWIVAQHEAAQDLSAVLGLELEGRRLAAGCRRVEAVVGGSA